MVKVIHRLWLGPAEMPADYKQWGLDWQRLNHEWVVKDWTQQEIESMPWHNQTVYDDLGIDTHPIAAATQRADVLGYEIMYRYGGLYVNTDIQPVRPLYKLFEKHDDLFAMPMVSMEDELWVTNGVLWSPRPWKPFWLDIIEDLPRNYFDNPGRMMNEVTGPHLLAKHVAKQEREVLVLDRTYFNPVHYSEVQQGQNAMFDMDALPANTIGVHHWGHKRNNRPHVSKEHA